MAKKFKDTKVGKFLLNNGSGIVNTLGDALPSNGVLGIVKGLIDKDDSLPPEDKEKALKLLEMDMVEMQEISKRWSSDMSSDSWLSKNTRPMTLIFLTVSMVCLILLDSFNITFEVNTGWVDLLKSLLITVYVAYFGSRGVEKFKSASHRLVTSCISTISISSSFKAFSLASGGNDSSLSISPLTMPKTPLEGNTSPNVPTIPEPLFIKNLPTFVSLNFFFIAPF